MLSGPGGSVAIGFRSAKIIAAFVHSVNVQILAHRRIWRAVYIWGGLAEMILKGLSGFFCEQEKAETALHLHLPSLSRPTLSEHSPAQNR